MRGIQSDGCGETDISNAQKPYHGLGYFHLARGLGMLYIIFGHSVTPFFNKMTAMESDLLFSGAGTVFGGGVIAMFFMLSGFGAVPSAREKKRRTEAGRDIGRFLSVQWRCLLRPYVTAAVLILLVKWVLSILKARSFAENGGELVLTFLLGLNAEGGGIWGGCPVDSVGVFWFLLALAGGGILRYLIRMLPAAWMRITAAAVCTAAGYVLTRISDVWPYCLPLMLLAVGYLTVGNAVYTYNLLDRKLSVWLYAGSVLLTAASFAFGAVNFAACFFRCGLLDIAASYVIGFWLLRLYCRLMKHLPEREIPPVAFAENIGRYSMRILCLHAFEKMLFPWYRLQYLFPDHTLLCILFCFIGRLILIFCLSACMELLKRGQYMLRNKKDDDAVCGS